MGAEYQGYANSPRGRSWWGCAEAVKVCTFHGNKFKAFAIARGELSILATSTKTFAFVRNIGALDETKVTIDLWHLRACFGATIETGLTLKRYRELERITIEEAKKVGLKGYEFRPSYGKPCAIRGNIDRK